MLRNIKVPTGNICVIQGDHGLLEFVVVGDYGKDANIKADFLGITRELNGVPNGEIESLEKKMVVTISTQYGCAMDCKFCDVPKVGNGRNATLGDLKKQLLEGIKLHKDITNTKRLNIHFARMGEPTFNLEILYLVQALKERSNRCLGGLNADTVHLVISTMMPKNNRYLKSFLLDWCNIKNGLYKGEAGLQLSINSTDDKQRDYMFSNNALSLIEVSVMADALPMPVGRKYTLNFALADDYIIDAKKLVKLFDPAKFICKITPLHVTTASTENDIITTDGYDSFVPYKDVEEALKAEGFDVIVFVPSYDEDLGLITCGNAILSGSVPHKFEELV